MPDWALVLSDGTFGNRFDDSENYYRVLYAAGTPLACYVETLAKYRKPPDIEDLLAQFDAIEGAPGERIPFGKVPKSWAARRVIGEAVPKQRRFADVYSAEWLSYLRRELEPRLMARRIGAEQDFDLAYIASQDRTLTQEISTIAYHLGFDGIYYQSRHGTDLENWALFEPCEFAFSKSAAIDVEGPEFQQALRLLNLVLDRSL